MNLKNRNRPNKHKDKKSSGCGLCKPHKHGERAMKDKERLHHEAEGKEISVLTSHFGDVFREIWDNEKDTEYDNR